MVGSNQKGSSMKKLYVMLLAAVFMLGDVCSARVDAQNDEPRPKKHKVKKEKVHKAKKEKAHKEKPHKAKKAKAHKDKPNKVKKIKVRKDKEEKKHEKRQASHAKKQKVHAKKEERVAKVHAKREKKDHKKHVKNEGAKHKERALQENHASEARRKRQDVLHERAERSRLIANWDRVSADQQHKELAAGAQADLFSLPAVPSRAIWHEGKNFVNVGMKYNYACNAYGSDGSSSNRNVTQLAFGEDAINFNDISLVNKLVDAGALSYKTDAGVHFLTDGSTGKLNVWGRDEKYQMDFEIGRYIINRDVAVGVNVPVVYNKHKLRITPEVDRIKTGEQQLFTQVDGPSVLRDLMLGKGMSQFGGSAMGMGDVSFYANYQINSVHFDKLVFGVRGVAPTAKKPANHKLWAPELGNGGFFEAGAFSSVLMNYQKYLNPFVMVDVNFCAPAHVDRRVPKKIAFDAVPAINIANGDQIPTSLIAVVGAPGTISENRKQRKDAALANANALNANQKAANLAGRDVLSNLGLGDRAERSSSVAEAVNAVIAAIDDTPVRTAGTTAGSVKLGESAAFVLGAGAGEVELVGPVAVIPARDAVSVFDTTVKGFADRVQNIKLKKGVQVNVRVGNTIERFITPRGFMDLFYDFRAKGRDRASGLDRTNYNLDIIEKDSVELEHRMGLEYSYQHDQFTRTHLGVGYTFAGMNVPKTFEVSGSLNHSF